MTTARPAKSDLGERIDAANAEVVRRITTTEATWVGVSRALDVVPGMHPRLILHSGPPIDWKRMAPVQKESVVGAVLFEGLARDAEEAAMLITKGDIEIGSAHAHSAVGAMTGATSASMAMLVVEASSGGRRGYCKLVERQLQFGQRSPEIFENLTWLSEGLGPALDKAVRSMGGVPLIPITAQALHMGDECHNRNVAATALLAQRLAPVLAETADPRLLPRIFGYFKQVDQAFLGLAMAAAKAITDSVGKVADSSVVTAMARNGVDFGIKVAGLGDRWFTGPAQVIDGAFMAGYGPADATNDIGDSTIVETIGLGGMAMANALTAGAISGGRAQDAIERTRENMEITAGRSRSFTLPILDFQGTPVGVDVRKVVRTGITPFCLTGIAANRPPWGRIGGGIVRPPAKPFADALRELGRAIQS